MKLKKIFIPDKRNFYSFISGICLILVFIIINGCSKNNSDAGDENKSGNNSNQVVVPVKVDKIKKETLDVTIPAYGITSAQQNFQIVSPVAGVVTKFNFFNGDEVKKGETILSIITKESYAVIKGAETLLKNAITDEQKKEAERTIQIAEKSSNQINITAPFTGVLVNRQKNEHELVSEGELIGALLNKNSVLFIAQVPSDSINLVKIGQPVRLVFPSIHNKNFGGIVKRIVPRVNPASQTIPVQIELKSPNEILPDSLYGEASIIIGKHKDVFVVPSKAVIHNDENNTYSITLINPESIAYDIIVNVGVKKDSIEEIYSSSLKEGMQVIVEGNYGLPDSTKVRIKQ